MAKEKFFHLHRKSDATDHLVRALKEGDAIAAVGGNQWTARVASKDDIADHFLAEGTLHEGSIPEGQGARFIYLVPKDGAEPRSVLIRAKNLGAAVAVLTSDNLTCTVADEETLVRLLNARVPVVDAVPQRKAAAQADGGSEGAGANDALGTDGTDGAAANDASGGSAAAA
ncbi:hypothetical protein H8Z72_22630 (plasmid) [Xanthomonas citri pv. citri]|uniref:hypothetical protein n=1 Tax=Xanthomonas citri TaxID=346 RepID=UPI001931CCC5|nr:hypothetical protein [Xanthomonas citri]QRD62673.1 hypothetical protein H8Z74_23555 [Xanthomonas citri pv. citri]QRD67208.1 hypothetical protein H8Z73_22535 [Xanthomonas citri pv. citri]QRD71747.1 hypothetical protein H8Z72_22630 [Xanthomonas citri pv. citri]